MASATVTETSHTEQKINGNSQENMDFPDGMEMYSWKRTLKNCFVVAACILPLLAFDATSWIIKDAWTGSGNFIQSQWERLYDFAEGDPFYLLMFAVAGVTNAAFILACTLLTIVDLTGKPAFLLRYKVQEDKNVPLDPKRLKEAIKVAVINQTIVGFPLFYLAYKVSVWRGCDYSRELPSFSRFLFEFVFAVIIEEIGFYYSHRLMHHPLLYKRIHKRHHEWTAPIGVTAVYAHPVEHILSNLAPVLAGPILCGAHVFSTAVWTVAALLTTTISHSGYHFPFLPSPEMHDYHHLKFNQCYGVLGILDDLHNTNDQFKASIQFKRHYTAFNGTPPREMYAENNPKQK